MTKKDLEYKILELKNIITKLGKENKSLKDNQLEDKKLINKLNYDLEHYGENRTLAGRPIYIDKQVSEIIDKQYKELLKKDDIIIELTSEKNKILDKLYRTQDLLNSKQSIQVDRLYSQTIGMEAKQRFLKIVSNYVEQDVYEKIKKELKND